MPALSTLFEQFLRHRRYLQNVTPKTLTWYQTAFDAFSRTVAVGMVVIRGRCRGSRRRPDRPVDRVYAQVEEFYAREFLAP